MPVKRKKLPGGLLFTALMLNQESIKKMEERHNNMSRLDQSLAIKLSHPLKDDGQRQRQQDQNCCPCFSMRTLIVVTNVLIVVACSATLLFQAGQCAARYFAGDTKAILSVRNTGDATFLAFTICPAYEVAYKEHELEAIGISRSDYKKGNFYGNYTISDDEDGFSLFERFTFSLSEMMYDIVVTTTDSREPTTRIAFDAPLDERQAVWTVNYDENFGRCYSMQLAQEVTVRNVIDVIFRSKISIYVYLHHPAQKMDVDSKTKVYGYLGKLLFIDLTYELTLDTLGSSGGIPCNTSMDSRYDDCVQDQIGAILHTEYGCVVPFLPPQQNREKSREVCNFSQEEKREDLMKRYSYFSSNGQRGLCQLPCSTIEVFLGLPFPGDDGKSNVAFIKIYVKSTVKVNRTVLDYTWVSMLAEIGGYTGLLLGISVVDITSFVDRLLLRICKKR